MQCVTRHVAILVSFGLMSGEGPCFAQTNDHVWIIGGGADVDSGGVQIENSVHWVIKVLEETPGERTSHIYFGDGTDPGKDVVEWSTPPDTHESLQPIARVYGNQVQNGEIYRSNTVPNVRGSSRREELLESLSSDFRDLHDGDRALIIYNGHGLRSDDDPGDNTLRLWGDTRVTAREFESLLGEIDPSVQTRFLFTQCFSGGFGRLIHLNGNDALNLAEGNRCGFLASSVDQEAEGCSPNTLGGDYRDYTSYFFGAITGETRTGEVIHAGIDLDGDGAFTLFDAHLSALANGFSRSVPRSTSETFLEMWQPWYLRWIDTSSAPNNFYSSLFEKVRAELSLPTERAALNAEIDDRLQTLRQRMDELASESDTIETTVTTIQADIQSEVGKRWPEARNPYTRQFLEFLLNDLETAQTFIVDHGDYPRLVSLQSRQLQIEQDVLYARRLNANMEKVLRLRKLARIYDQFQRFAADDIKNDYESVRSCERSDL